MTDTTTIRIADAPIPPPSAARLHPTRPQLYRRQSRFTEEMTEEHTPVPSLYEHDETSRSHIHPPPASPLSTTTPRHGGGGSLSHILRGMNGCAHGAACVILIAIMLEFLTQSRGHWHGKISAQAVALLVFLGVDTALDVISLIRLHTPWPTWALLLRVASGTAYIALFFAYIARDRVFPPGFTFWAMPPGVAGPLVYGFLWLLGVWSLAHIALRRHRFGRGLRSYYRGLHDRPQPPPHLFPAPAPRHRAARTPTWRRWTATTTTQTRRHDDDERDVEGFTPRVGTALLPLREEKLQQHRDRAAERRRQRQGSLHSTVSSTTACDRGEGEDKGLGGLGEEKEDDLVVVPERVVVKMG
ncbi:hypothetical protein QBC39DRAFT_407295 [Podospora conica]|nr:hypothetical protein QBC39DRAFT_407295 [Schizothecium conicum]